MTKRDVQPSLMGLLRRANPNLSFQQLHTLMHVMLLDDDGSQGNSISASDDGDASPANSLRSVSDTAMTVLCC